jgi:hypothetical protein
MSTSGGRRDGNGEQQMVINTAYDDLGVRRQLGSGSITASRCVWPSSRSVNHLHAPMHEIAKTIFLVVYFLKFNRLLV